MSLALGAIARSRNMSQVAQDAGLTREGLEKALSAEGNPRFATITKIARALGLRLRFEPAKSLARLSSIAGFLEIAPPDEALSRLGSLVLLGMTPRLHCAKCDQKLSFMEFCSGYDVVTCFLFWK